MLRESVIDQHVCVSLITVFVCIYTELLETGLVYSDVLIHTLIYFWTVLSTPS